MAISKSANSRVFLIEGRARPDHTPSYESNMRMTGISQGFGDIERIEAPDPRNYGQFVEVAEIRGATERATTSLEGRYALDLKSKLLDLALKGCGFDVQLHFGECTDPSLFNVFKKIIVLENANITNFGTDDLGALESGDNAAVNETADVSAEKVYEILPLSFAQQAGSIVTTEIVDTAVVDSISCGECEQTSDGCSKLFAVTAAAGGSPSTPADVVFSPDRGASWFAHDVDSLGAAEAPNAIDGVAGYIVVVSNASASLHYADEGDFDGITDPVFTEVSTGFVAGGEPNDIHSLGAYAFIVGDGGYVYGTEDPTSGVTTLDAGNATVDDLLCVHAYSEEVAVAGGNNGAVVYTENGTNWTAATRPVGVGINITAVFAKNKQEWFVGTSDGRIFYTINKGVTWTASTFSGSGSGRVDAIVGATDSVMYAAHATTTPRGRILRSYDGGRTWTVMPESGTLPLNDRINGLAVCWDANFVFAGGLADDGSDGMLLLGTAS